MDVAAQASDQLLVRRVFDAWRFDAKNLHDEEARLEEVAKTVKAHEASTMKLERIIDVLARCRNVAEDADSAISVISTTTHLNGLPGAA